MNKLLGEILKVDNAVVPTAALAPAAMAASRPYPVGRERKALFVLSLFSGTFQDTDVLDFGIVDNSIAAPAASGALAALVAAGSPAVMAFQNVTASVRASAVSVDVAAAAAGSVTINGVVFPFAALPALPAEWSNAATLAVAINTVLPVLTAADVGTVVTIISTVAGEQAITIAAAGAWFAVGDLLTLEAVAYLEVDMEALTPGAANLVAVIDNPVANTGLVDVSVALLRGDARYDPVPQAVA